MGFQADDNPKEKMHFGKPLDQTLWEAPLFPVCQTMSEAVRLALSGGTGERMISLCDSFNEADVTALLPWQEKLDDRIKAESLLSAIENGTPAAETAKIFKGKISERAIAFLNGKAEALDEGDLASFRKKIRIYYYLSCALSGRAKEKHLSLCFNTIREAVTKHSQNRVCFRSDAKIVKDGVSVSLPVRINFGGGWSDTPPYCLENGGTVLNAAITLNGKYPVEVQIKRLEEDKIVLASTDNGSLREFLDITSLQDCRNPADPFALHKAALIACGVIPERERVTLSDITRRLGGGLYLSTCVRDSPRGSGLGTSSILAGACVKAIYELLGIEADDGALYDSVMSLEQIMSTGGGWQDQVGGLTPGIKLISTAAGITQKIHCTPLVISEDTLKELSERFAIVYTGQRRLARNLLRSVVGNYIGASPETLDALREIQRIAVLMRFELEKGNLDGFAALLSEHWLLSQKIDRGCTNTCIDQIFLAIDDLIDGKMICGAGGGGFLQVVMKQGVTLDDLRARLDSVFSESGVDAWQCEFCF